MRRVALLAAVLALTAVPVPGGAAAAAASAKVQAIDPACEGMPIGRFVDVAGPHADAVDCIGWWGITQGLQPGIYDPRGSVTRAQMATFIAKAVELTGGTLPAAGAGRFDDVTGTHTASIERLAAAGIVDGVSRTRFGPDRAVTRAQMATFLAGAWSHRAGQPLPDATAVFGDIVGQIHEGNISRIAAAGLSGGVTADTYDPDGQVTRAQMATFLARFTAKLVEGVHAASAPAAPVAIPALSAGPAEPATLATGYAHACAVQDGTVHCWGGDTTLGGASAQGGRFGYRTTPGAVKGVGGDGSLTGIASIESSPLAVCAVTTEGEVRCWGDVHRSGSVTTFPTPVPAADGQGNLTGVRQLAMGSGHTCALLGSGEVRCWGSNYSGQLGDGSRTDRSRPVTVRGLDGTGALTEVVQLEAGASRTCALRSDTSVVCWGDNSSGSLDGVSGFCDWHEGRAYCYRGTELVEGDLRARTYPVPVRGVDGRGHLRGVRELTVANTWLHSVNQCGVLIDGRAVCWGDNEWGELGNGRSNYLFLEDGEDPFDDPFRDPDEWPVNLAGPVVGVGNTGVLRDVADVSAGGGTNCALQASGRVVCWGRNAVGEFGEWGLRGEGTLGVGWDEHEVVPYPLTVKGPNGSGALTGVVEVETSDHVSCARRTDGSVWCWGANNWGQIGDGTRTAPAYPTRVRF